MKIFIYLYVCKFTHDMMNKTERKKRINVSIREDQYEMIVDNDSLNFSGWVRDMIDKNLMNNGSTGDKK